MLRRLELLDEPVGPLTLGQRRAGHALAQATLVLRHSAAPGRQPRCALQGFGTLGRAAALSLHDAGALITVIADEHGSLRYDAGLDVPRMLAGACWTAHRRAPLRREPSPEHGAVPACRRRCRARGLVRTGCALAT